MSKYTAKLSRILIRIEQLLLLLCILFSSTILFSQEQEITVKQNKLPAKYLIILRHDIGNIVSYKPDIKRVNWRKTIFLCSAVFTAALFEENIAKRFSEEQTGDFEKFFNNFEPFGNGRKLNIVGGVTLIGSTILQKGKVTEASFTMLEGLFITQSTVSVLKYVIGRARPNESNRNTKFKPANGEYNSLPSGHTNSAFTTASILSEYYPKMGKYFYSAAIAVGLQRVSSNAHWLSDVILGGVIGHYSGKLIARSHIKLFPIVSSDGTVRASLSVPLK